MTTTHPRGTKPVHTGSQLMKELATSKPAFLTLTRRFPLLIPCLPRLDISHFQLSFRLPFFQFQTKIPSQEIPFQTWFLGGKLTNLDCRMSRAPLIGIRAHSPPASRECCQRDNHFKWTELGLHRLA